MTREIATIAALAAAPRNKRPARYGDAASD